MCDTLGFIHNGKAVFGKNSDRSPNEPQVLEFHPAGEHKAGDIIRATYITVPQVNQTHAVFLSRPSWLWGAEIGVNDCGVCIGNEAVWTLGKYGKTGLTGMDMLRLSLERSGSAEAAVKTLIELLETYGQGGNCGYDHDFYYDNSFLAMDRKQIYVLETAGKKWVYKSYERAAISNRLSIGKDGDSFCGESCDFALRHSERLYNIASGSANRKKQTSNALYNAESAADIMNALRQHAPGSEPFLKGSVTSPCMHFGGIVGDHTTASIVVDLREDSTVIWATGCSCPCISLYKPILFGAEPCKAEEEGEAYWKRSELLNREFIGKAVPRYYYSERDAIQQKWIERLEKGDNTVFSDCFEEEKAFRARWSGNDFDDFKPSAGCLNRWAKKNAVL